MTFLSVIIPLYNVEKYIAQGVESILGQKFKDVEIILVDDCSTDKSGEICDFYSSTNDNVAAIHKKKNMGVSHCRNVGIKKAKGEYVLFLDSDDFLQKNGLDNIERRINEKPDVDVFFIQFEIVPKTSHENVLENSFDRANISNNETDDVVSIIKEQGVGTFPTCCWCYIIKRNFILSNHLEFLPAKIFEDRVFAAKMLCLCKKFSFLDWGIYCHRRRPGSLGRTMSPAYAMSAMIAINGLCELALDQHLKLTQKKIDFIFAILKGVFYEFIPCLLSSEKTKELSEYIDKNLNNLKLLRQDSSTNEFFDYIEKYGAFKGLEKFKSDQTKKVISLLDEKGNATEEDTRKNLDIYLFCAGRYAEGIANALTNEGYKVKGFFDNSEMLQKSTIFNMEVKSPGCLSSLNKDEIDNSFVIICSPNFSNIKNITEQLKAFGLKDNQITHSKNIWD